MTSIPGSKEPGIDVVYGTFVLLTCFRYNGGRKNKGGEVNEINL